MNYFAEGDLLLIVDDSGTLLWPGKLQGHEGHTVCWAQGAPSSRDGFVLLDYYRPEKRYDNLENLVRISPLGSIVFRAELPERSGDAYVSAELQNGRLFAHSWSGHRVEIDMSTGRIIERTFTK